MKNWRIWLFLVSIVIVGPVAYFSSAPLKSAESYEGTRLSGIAPDFRLTDQYGELVSLSDFGGRIVALTFMDSQCKDVCPLTAAQLLQAYKQLDQREIYQVVFMAVNVNIQANTDADAMLATQNWHLDELPSWHFLTGSAEELASIWKAYGVSAISQESNDVIHTPGVFLIDQARQKRWYISTPYSAGGNVELALPLSELLVRYVREILGDK